MTNEKSPEKSFYQRFELWKENQNIEHDVGLGHVARVYAYWPEPVQYLEAALFIPFELGEEKAKAIQSSLSEQLLKEFEGTKWGIRLSLTPKFPELSEQEQKQFDDITTWMKAYCERFKECCWRDGEEILWFHEIGRQHRWDRSDSYLGMFCVEYSYDQEIGEEFAEQALEALQKEQPKLARNLGVYCVRYR